MNSSADLFSAAKTGDCKVLRIATEKAETDRILDSIDMAGNSLLHVATEHGRVSVVKLLISKGVNVNVKNKKGDTPLLLAVDNEYPDIAGHLLKAKDIKVDMLNAEGYSALMLAAGNGDHQLTQGLLELGAAPNLRDENGDTALTWASYNDYPQMVKKLLDHNADVGSSNKDGETALDVAAAAGHDDVVHLLLERGADPNSVDKAGNTSLTHAATYGRTGCAALLLNKGANINHANNCKETPLITAARSKNEEVLRLLLERGADVNNCNINQDTALTIAAFMNAASTVRVLLQYGADPSARNEHCHTAVEVSRSKLVREILQNCHRAKQEPRNGNRGGRRGGGGSRSEEGSRNQGAGRSRAFSVGAAEVVVEDLRSDISSCTAHSLSPCQSLEYDEQYDGGGGGERGPQHHAVPVPSQHLLLPTHKHTSSAAPPADSNPAPAVVRRGSAGDTSIGTRGKTAAKRVPSVVTPQAPAVAGAMSGNACPSSSSLPIHHQRQYHHHQDLRHPIHTHIHQANTSCPTPSFTCNNTGNSSWLSRLLAQSGMAQQWIQHCDDQLVVSEGFASQRIFSSVHPDRFTEAYLDSLGIRGLGIKHELLRLHREMHEKHREEEGGKGEGLESAAKRQKVEQVQAQQAEQQLAHATQQQAHQAEKQGEEPGNRDKVAVLVEGVNGIQS